jgi:hypothetical protein
MRFGTSGQSSVAGILRRSHGWLELGCPSEAFEELDRLPDTLHSTREVLKLKCNILATARNWRELRRLSSTAAMYFPQEPTFAEDWAWAEHKEGNTAQAYSILIHAAEKYEKTWRTAYYLSCFTYSMKRVRESTEWLGLALLLHSAPTQLRQRTLREEDFSLKA